MGCEKTCNSDYIGLGFCFFACIFVGCSSNDDSSDGSYTGNLIRVYFYGKAPDGIDQSFGYTWDAEGFAVYVASQYYDEYKNANASNWQRCVVKTGILFKFDPANKPFTED